MKIFSIQNKVILAILFTVLLPIVMISFLNFNVAERVLLDFRITSLTSVLNLKADHIENFYLELRKEINFLQSNQMIIQNLPTLEKHFSNTSSPQYLKSANELNKTLRALQIHKRYDDIFLLNSTGKIVYASEQVQAWKWLGRTLSKKVAFPPFKKTYEIYFSNIFHDPTKGSNFNIVAIGKIHDQQDRLLGSIAIEAPMDTVHKNMLNTEGLGETGEALLLKNLNGDLQFISPSRHAENATLENYIKTPSFLLPSHKQATKEHVATFVDYRGKQVIAVWKKIEGLNWILMVKMDKAEALSGIYQVRNTFYIISIAVMIVVLLFAFFLAASITKPLTKLTNIIKNVKGDTFDIKLAPSLFKRQDEIGLLTHTLNSMRKQVKKYMGEIQYAREVADEANRIKSQFLANMSHELRTPMNAILGMLSLTLESELTPKQRRYLLTASSSGNSLMTLLNDILDLSKIEAGKLQIEIIEFNLHQHAEDIIQLYREHAYAKKIELILAMSPDLPQWVFGDPVRIRQIFSNILSNAIKFTDEGGEILVSIDPQKQQDEMINILFSVKDTGIGIDEETQKILFKPFVQADSSTTRKYGGTGLGLVLSKNLVHQMEGEIHLTSEPGKGSTFSFTLPFMVSKGHVSFNPHPTLTNKQVLIVNQHETHRRILESYTRKWSMITKSTDNGEKALALLHKAYQGKEPFEIVLLDCLLPDISGIELAQQIKAEPNLQNTRLLMLGYSTIDFSDAQLEQQGVDAFMLTPVRYKQLHDNILKSLTLGTQETLKPAVSTKNRTIKEGARVLLVEDNAINQEVTATMLKRMGIKVDIANHGEEGIDKLKERDYDLILMDCLMPIMDGFKATQFIREHETPDEHRTIIAVTAMAREEDKERCLKAGMDDYISKPIDAKTLKEKMTFWLSVD